MKQPNILLILCDQYRGDCFSFKGHPDVLTPNLDTLAALGQSYDHMYSATPSCIPARATLFTGKEAKHHKRVGYEDGLAWTYENMLPELMTKAGYQTQCVGKLHVDPPRNNCGFERVLLHDGYLGHYRNVNLEPELQQENHDDYLKFLKEKKGQDADTTITGIDPNSWIARPWPYEEELHPTNWVTTESINFLKHRDKTKPFFLMSSFVRPHQPFDAPRDFFEMYSNVSLRDPHVGSWEDNTQSLKHGAIKNSIYGTQHKRYQQLGMQGYYACITHVDHQIGRLLMSLEEQQVLDDTVILFLSDHGELLFDHHTYRKVFPYQGSVQVPLIVNIGKNVGTIKNNTPTTLVELKDILPTCVDFAGGEIPSDVDGQSLKESILDDKPINREYLHGEHAFHSQLSNQWIVTERDKYIWYSETNVEQYFDLVNDPNELTNLIDDESKQARINYLKSLLVKELEGRPEGFVVNHQLNPVKKVVNTL